MADQSFEKQRRLLSSEDFSGLRIDPKTIAVKNIRCFFKNNNSDCSRLGISVSRKVGKANLRNFCKRQTRELFRKVPLKNKGIDFLVVVSPNSFKGEGDIEEKKNYFKRSLNLLFCRLEAYDRSL